MKQSEKISQKEEENQCDVIVLQTLTEHLGVTWESERQTNAHKHTKPN